MGDLSKCHQQPCTAPPSWRMVARLGHIAGVLCQHHKRTWYDIRQTHNTTIERIAAANYHCDKPEHKLVCTCAPPLKEESNAMDTEGAGDWGVGESESTSGTDAARRTDDRGLGTNPMGRGNDHSLTIRTKPSELVDSTIGREGETAILPASPQDSDGQRYGTLGLTADEQNALREPVDAAVVEIRPDGIVYTPWCEVADRLDYALGAGDWTLVPEGRPALQDGYTCWTFHLFVRGRWAAMAIGEHPDNKFSKMSLANRAESAKSDALVKCSKALGIFRELWRPGWRMEWQRKYAERVWALQYERSTAGQWLWRRKDRSPFFKERPAKDDMKTEYAKTRDYDDDASDHLDSIQAES